MERLARIGIMRLEEMLERFEGGSLSHAEAASALGVSERTLPAGASATRTKGPTAWSIAGSANHRPGGPPRTNSSACARCISSATRASPSSTSTRSSRSATATSSATPPPGSTSKRPARSRRRRGAAPIAASGRPADARDAAAPGRAPGRREAPLARRPAGARPDHHPQAAWGRRHQRDPLGLPGRGRGHFEAFRGWSR